MRHNGLMQLRIKLTGLLIRICAISAPPAIRMSRQTAVMRFWHGNFGPGAALMLRSDSTLVTEVMLRRSINFGHAAGVPLNLCAFLGVPCFFVRLASSGFASARASVNNSVTILSFKCMSGRVILAEFHYRTCATSTAALGDMGSAILLSSPIFQMLAAYSQEHA
jgi:hypothetical protein